MDALDAKSLGQYFTTKSLHLVILPTEQCNLRCLYCYETFGNKTMPLEVVASICNLLDRRAPGLQELKLGWFGGEPLLALAVILDIARHARGLASRYSGLSVVSGMSTNGLLLTGDVARSLADADVKSFQITLDGPKEYHDTLRVHRNGSGSFDSIWRNLLQLREAVDLDIAVILRVHMSSDNLPLLPPFLKELDAAFGPDPRFQLFLKALAPLGGSHDSMFHFLDSNEERQAREDLLDCAQSLRVSAEPRSEYVCYAAMPTSFVIRANGNVVKCTVGLDDAVNQIGQLTPVGIRIDQPSFRRWIEGTAALDSEFMRCPRSVICRSTTPVAGGSSRLRPGAG